MFIELNLLNPGTLLRLPLNGINVVLLLFCIIPTFKIRKKLFFQFGLCYFLLYCTWEEAYLIVRKPGCLPLLSYITFLDCLYHSKINKNKFRMVM